MSRTQHAPSSAKSSWSSRASRTGAVLALCAAVGAGTALGFGAVPSVTGIGGPGTMSVQPANIGGPGTVYVTPTYTGIGGPGTMSTQPANSTDTLTVYVTPSYTGIGGPGTM